jgi:hypothetical protein
MREEADLNDGLISLGSREAAAAAASLASGDHLVGEAYQSAPGPLWRRVNWLGGLPYSFMPEPSARVGDASAPVCRHRIRSGILDCVPPLARGESGDPHEMLLAASLQIRNRRTDCSADRPGSQRKTLQFTFKCVKDNEPP